jgi:hypothetical protein
MLRSEATELAHELGKRLGKKAISLMGCTKSFKFSLLMLLTGTNRDLEEMWDDVPDERIEQSIMFGLGLRREAMLPYTHARAEYEGPMLAVLLQRHENYGNRLKGMSPERAMMIGYFVHDMGKECGKVWSLLHNRTFDLPFAEAFMQKATDWHIVANCTLDAKLTSKILAVEVKLLCLAVAAGCEFQTDTAPFEHPEAAKQFEQFALPDDQEAEEVPGGQRVKAAKKRAKAAAKKSAGKAKAKPKASRRTGLPALPAPNRAAAIPIAL